LAANDRLCYPLIPSKTLKNKASRKDHIQTDSSNIRDMTFSSRRVCRWILSVTCIVLIRVPMPAARAETLKDVLSSRAMMKVQQDTDRSRRRRDTDGTQLAWLIGMDPNSNFAEVWATGKGSELLCSWALITPKFYRVDLFETQRVREMVRCSQRFRTRSGEKIRVDIMVPHPTYRDMVRLGTVRQFNEVQPPAMNVLASEELEIGGHKATYYRAERNKCTVLFKLTKGTLVNVWVPDCKWSDTMLELSRGLDLERLIKKLES
jgi:hypothetical protein